MKEFSHRPKPLEVTTFAWELLPASRELLQIQMSFK